MRYSYFDIAKFLVMLMVASGHLTGNMIVGNCMPQWYSNFNIGVAMPLFFIISSALELELQLTTRTLFPARWVLEALG